MSSDSIRINNLPLDTAPVDGDSFVFDGTAGVRRIPFSNLKGKATEELSAKVAPLLYNNAGAHNGIFRGKSLGTSFTAAQSAAITAGTFEDMYVGDYWTINGVVYRIAGFNIIKNCGDTVSITNNVCIVPDSSMGSKQMNSTDTTEGGYVNSEMRTTNLTDIKTIISTAFGSDHLITYRDVLANAVSNGQASGWVWYDCCVELMSEVMVYGTKVWGNSGYEVGCINEQLPLFRLNPESIHRRFYYWLRSVGSAAGFAYVSGNGLATNAGASYAFEVRPFFFVH